MIPSNLQRSLLSLRSICLTKIAGRDLIDNKELLNLFYVTRNVVQDYQKSNALPELQIVLDRLPDPKTFETKPPAFAVYLYLYEIILGLISGVFIFFSPLYGVPLLLILVITDLFIRLSIRKRNAAIADALRQIADACSSMEMVIRNNESYKTA